MAVDNLIGLQDDLKSMSDRQLLDAMQGGSAPQFMILAEMQSRKKMRSEAQSKPQQPSTVLADNVQGLTAMPQNPTVDMYGGGIVGFAAGKRVSGYQKGAAEACYTDPMTGKSQCPPSQAKMLKSPTQTKKKFAEGKKVDGIKLEAQALMNMLDEEGVDTSKFSLTDFETIVERYSQMGFAPRVTGEYGSDEYRSSLRNKYKAMFGEKPDSTGKTDALIRDDIPSVNGDGAKKQKAQPKKAEKKPEKKPEGIEQVLPPVTAEQMISNLGESRGSLGPGELAPTPAPAASLDPQTAAQAIAALGESRGSYGPGETAPTARSGLPTVAADPADIAEYLRAQEDAANVAKALRRENAEDSGLPVVSTDPADVADYRRAQEDAANVAKALRRENAELTPDEADTQRRLQTAADIERALYKQEVATDAAGLSGLAKATEMAKNERIAGGDLSDFARANVLAANERAQMGGDDPFYSSPKGSGLMAFLEQQQMRGDSTDYTQNPEREASYMRYLDARAAEQAKQDYIDDYKQRNIFGKLVKDPALALGMTEADMPKDLGSADEFFAKELQDAYNREGLIRQKEMEAAQLEEQQQERRENTPSDGGLQRLAPLTALGTPKLATDSPIKPEPKAPKAKAKAKTDDIPDGFNEALAAYDATLSEEDAARLEKQAKEGPQGIEAIPGGSGLNAADRTLIGDFAKRQEEAKQTGATSDPLMDLYNEIKAERAKEKDSGLNEFLMRAGLAAAAAGSKSGDFLGSIAAGGLEGLKGMAEEKKLAQKERQESLSDMVKLIGSRELSVAKGSTAQQKQADSLLKAAKVLSDKLENIGAYAGVPDIQKAMESDRKELQNIMNRYYMMIGMPTQTASATDQAYSQANFGT